VTVRAPLQQDAGTTPAASTAGCAEEPANAAGEITVQALRESFPQWRIFWQAGEWWALRGGPVRLDGPESLLLRCITAADLTGLAEKLCLQERLDRLDPQELAAVYEDKTLPRASRVTAGRRADPGSWREAPR
jgi:hypothetical protein